MTGRSQRMEELFAQALERPASERAAFLAETASGDEALRAELEKLLATHAQSSGFLEPDSAVRTRVLQSIEASPVIGSSLGPYRIEELLGRGGMGIVYRAIDTSRQVQVAIKVLRPEALADPLARKRFAQECRAAAALDHPSIIRVHAVDHQNGVDFLVMEFVTGSTLRNLMAAGPVPYREAFRYARQIAGALAAAHSKGVTHRDIKPANIMITDAGQAMVLDFGLCQWSVKQTEGYSSTHTQAGMVLGTPAYMSPEQAQGLPVGPQSDIFSFGALFYEMLSGRQAFFEPTTVATLVSILHEEPPFDIRIPAEAQPLLARCLAKNPAHRFQTGADLELALERIERALGRPPVVRAALRASGTIWRKRSRGAAWALAAAGLAGLAFLGWSVWNRASHTHAQTILTPDYVLSTDPAVSPDGTMLAYSSDRAGQGTLDLWLQTVQSGEAVRILHSDFDLRSPNFSPDGKTIAFRHDRGVGEICTVAAAGGAIKEIAAAGRMPRFSPDGKWIAYWTGPEGSADMFSPGVSHVYVVPAGGGAPRLIATELPTAAHPVWTPDSRAVLIPATADRTPGLQGVGIWLAPIDGRPATQILAPSRFRDWKIAGKPANANLFFRFAFPVAISRNGGLMLPVPVENHTEIYEFPLAAGRWTSAGAPRQVMSVSDQAGFPAFGSDDAVYFEESTRKASLWALPIDFTSGRPSGSPRELRSCRDDICQPFVSRDGTKIMFTVLQNSGSFGLAIQDLHTGKDSALVEDGADNGALSADGKYAFYTRLTMDTVSRPTTLYRVGTEGGAPELLCQECPHLWDVSADGRYVLGTASKPRQVILVELPGGAKTSLLRHPEWSLYRARFSPDGNWIAFTARGGSPGTRIFVAPFHPGREHPTTEWIPITPGDSQDGPMAWSPRGNALYFASERDGFRCFWTQRLDPSTKRPLGEPEPLQHFHSSRLSIKNIASTNFSFSVARDKVVYPLGDRTGRIWMMR